MRNKGVCLGLSIVVSAMVVAGVAAAVADDDKPVKRKALFNGKNLDGWKIMNNGRFSVRKGVIFLNRGGGWLRSEGTWQDFDLRMVFRFVDKNSNSGIFFRADDHPGPNRGYQVQTKDDQSICSIFNRGLKKPQVKKDTALLATALKPAGEWQEYRIVARGAKLEVYLNGKRITVAEGLEVRKGHIGIQGEGGTLEFRAIELGKPTTGSP